MSGSMSSRHELISKTCSICSLTFSDATARRTRSRGSTAREAAGSSGNVTADELVDARRLASMVE